MTAPQGEKEFAMTRNRLAAAAALALVMTTSAPIALAQDAAAPGAAGGPPDVASFDRHYAEMQAMHAQMDRIAKTQDPAERQKLLQEHWNSMQAAMGNLRGLWGQGGMGPGMMMGGGRMGGGPMGAGMMGWGGMRGYYHGLSPDQVRQRQYMSDQFMGMQQQMMEQMLEHQQWMFPQAPAGKGR